jgi:ankyrin repeat protein
MNPRSTADDLQYLVNMMPYSVEAATADGRTLMQLVSKRSKDALEMVKYLHKQCPQLIRRASEKGCLPLHLACQANASLEVITYLVKNHGDALSAYDRSGRLPFHYSCLLASPSVIDFLIGELEGSVLPTTLDGDHPVFLASQNCNDASRLGVLLKLVQHSLYLFPGNLNKEESRPAKRRRQTSQPSELD